MVTVIDLMREVAVPQPLSHAYSPVLQAIGVLGGLVIGSALVFSMTDRRRWAAAALLVIDAAMSVLALRVTYQLQGMDDLDRMTALDTQRNVVEAIAAVALAVVLWLYRRQVIRTGLPRAVGRIGH